MDQGGIPRRCSRSRSARAALSFGYSISLTQVDGVKQDDAHAFTPTVRVVTPGFFRVMGIPVRQGREFGETDRFGAAPVVVINETAARRIFPGIKAVDRTLDRSPGPHGDRTATRTCDPSRFGRHGL